jgi:hypothetical protein
MAQGSSANVIAAIASFLIPGLGQLAQGRGSKAAKHFLLCLLLWLIFCGWILNIWSAYEAATFEPEDKERLSRAAKLSAKRSREPVPPGWG